MALLLPVKRQLPPSGMLTKLGDIDVDQFVGTLTFIATCWFACDAVNV